MGMYTELIFGASIKKDAPKEVINTLYYLVNSKKLWSDVSLEESVTKGRNVLNGGGSYYFGVTDGVAKMGNYIRVRPYPKTQFHTIF